MTATTHHHPTPFPLIFTAEITERPCPSRGSPGSTPAGANRASGATPERERGPDSRPGQLANGEIIMLPTACAG